MTTRTARKQPTRNPSTVRAVPKPLTYRVIIRRAEEQELIFTAWINDKFALEIAVELDPETRRLHPALRARQALVTAARTLRRRFPVQCAGLNRLQKQPETLDGEGVCTYRLVASEVV